jgi:hypothetical protein
MMQAVGSVALALFLASGDARNAQTVVEQEPWEGKMVPGQAQRQCGISECFGKIPPTRSAGPKSFGKANAFPELRQIHSRLCTIPAAISYEPSDAFGAVRRAALRT